MWNRKEKASKLFLIGLVLDPWEWNFVLFHSSRKKSNHNLNYRRLNCAQHYRTQLGCIMTRRVFWGNPGSQKTALSPRTWTALPCSELAASFRSIYPNLSSFLEGKRNFLAPANKSAALNILVLSHQDSGVKLRSLSVKEGFTHIPRPFFSALSSACTSRLTSLL